MKPPKQTPLPDLPTGTPVILTDDHGRRWNTETRSEPWHVSGIPVVLVEGIAGGYRCDRLTPGRGDGLAHFRDRGAS